MRSVYSSVGRILYCATCYNQSNMANSGSLCPLLDKLYVALLRIHTGYSKYTFHCTVQLRSTTVWCCTCAFVRGGCLWYILPQTAIHSVFVRPREGLLYTCTKTYRSLHMNYSGIMANRVISYMPAVWDQ